MIRFQQCRGFRLFRLHRWQVELWLAPQGETVAAHIHRSVSSRFLNLWGRAVWTVQGKTRTVHGLTRRRSNGRPALAFYAVPAGVEHGFTVLSRFCLFLNFETLLHSKISSPAHDLEFTTRTP